MTVPNAVAETQTDTGAVQPESKGTAAPAQAPESGKAPSAPTQESLPLFFSKGKESGPESVKETGFENVDVSKLPPEIQAFAKGFQADYTRKTQKLADERRAYESRLEQITSLLAERLAPPKTQEATQEPSALEQIKSLREQGREDEAVALLLQAAREQAAKEMEPVRREAEIQSLQTSFRNIVSDMRSNDPLLSRYHDEVAKTFDDPSFAPYRGDILSSKETMQKWLPLLLRGIALEKHARFLEAKYESAVKEGIDKGIQDYVNKAKGIPPGKLINSGPATLNSRSAPAKSVREAVNMAMSQLTGQAQ